MTAPLFEGASLSKDERAWLERAVRRGVLRPAHVRQALSARASAGSMTLGGILVSLGYLKPKDVEDLERTTRRVQILPIPDAGVEVVQVYGSCTVIEPLGRGPSGPVYRALHADSGREVALKLLPPNALNRPFIRLFSRSAQIALGLQHPRAVRVIDAGVQGGTLFIASELVKGTSLLEFVRSNGPMPVGQASALLAQVAGAVGAGHAIGLVHGNLKPENILLTGKLDVKVVDFGLGRGDAGFLKQHADQAGSLVYSLAPEQWSTATVPASDFYQIGVLWHFMLTGKYPFEGRAFLEVRKKHEKAPIPSVLRAGVPMAADALLQRLLEKDPAGRMATTAEVLDSLRMMHTVRRTRRRT